jgi:Domain of unknown function DUF29
MELHTHQPLPVHMPPVFNSPQFAPHNFSPNPVSKLYDRDIYAWATENARLLQERRFDELDLTNLIDEVQDMAKSEQRSIFSHLKILLMHLLKWQFQSEKQTASWRLSIRNARQEIEDLVADSPSLQTRPAEQLATVYKKARENAADETELPIKTFPMECPYTIEQVLDGNWLPK